MEEHGKFANSNIEILERMEKAGLEPARDPINIVNSNGKPIYVEIHKVDPTKVLKFLPYVPKKASRIMKLLRTYEKYSKE